MSVVVSGLYTSNGDEPCHPKRQRRKVGSKHRLASVVVSPASATLAIQWLGSSNGRNRGLTDARILEHHPDLTLADLAAAWDYYATHHEEIEQAIKEAAEA
jgi:hypothetical protein